MPNLHLRAAKRQKNDEFYTLYSTVENELQHYTSCFAGKKVLCNCDGLDSNFWKYFHSNFSKLGLEKLTAIAYTPYKMDGFFYEYKSKNDDNCLSCIGHRLDGNGDFRSEASIEILKDADIIVTNPPFSLMSDYIEQLVYYRKQFLILGNLTSITTNKKIFRRIKDGLLWPGCNFNKTVEFLMPDDYELKGNAYVDENGRKHGFVPGICWITNLPIQKENKLELTCTYNKEAYPVFDHLPHVINVRKTAEIPNDYEGYMAVPITFLSKFDPEQFEIIDGVNRYCVLDAFGVNEQVRQQHSHCCNIGGKATFFRIVIKRK